MNGYVSLSMLLGPAGAFKLNSAGQSPTLLSLTPLLLKPRIQNAKARGVRLGRKKDLTERECLELRQKREQGALIKTLMKDYKLSKASMYRYLDGVKVAQAVD